MGTGEGERALLDEQIAYYRSIAHEYETYGVSGFPEQDVARVLDELRPYGDVLELACGPGHWTELLVRHATSLTAVDASPEMLARAAARRGAERARFVQGDLFTWQPGEDRYDLVFFGFWLSHVPMSRFLAFWEMVTRCLRPGGRVCFVDDNLRTADELVEGEASSTIQRRMHDGTTHRAVKVPHQVEALEQRLRAMGWDVELGARGSFYWGVGKPDRR
jgi:demethylmenaquinone methyltransferase/2-methoxy-6-polyprenyl-1,4-benzoquinol methylase